MKKYYLLVLAIPFMLLSCKQGKSKTVAQEVVKDVATTPETALHDYLNNGDNTMAWEVKDTIPLPGAKAYDLLLTSQEWRGHIWKHQLTIVVPDTIKHEGALLFITGGRLQDGLPKWSDINHKKNRGHIKAAVDNQAILAIIRQVPNQPLYGGLVEDQLISYTLHQFKNDKDYTWPLLFPMVKSATKAMDAVQEFAINRLGKTVDGFTVSGASKRGWTTWLAGASDKRAIALAPMVIDVLNMPVSLQYHLEAWNEYSIQIQDYTKLEIPQSVSSPDGKAITTMIDPYSYRKNFSTKPKMIFIGTNDEYWPVDAIKHYIDEIPGENYIHYVPNAGHGLGDGVSAMNALSAFWGHTLAGKEYPGLTYQIQANGTSATLQVAPSENELVGSYLWLADSDDRDFRDEEWTSTPLKLNKDNRVEETVPYPKEGYKAFYIDLEYQTPAGNKYTKSTRMYLVDSDEIL
ncbi:PhoPQ-activated pathogenicity-related family protein [Sinomicrobium oceani]|uniref:PhoPQ-activated pathogenicity-related family protein n=1 Tax=Sinomicrobium oceani TaxID=1150368 RepID=UPI00227C4871|nr:PhoPQ-activated protein PqaA family protein [Sinomicrobium oceani]